MGLLGEAANAKCTFWVETTESIRDPYVFGATGEMVAKIVTPTIDESRDIRRTRHSGSPDHISQAQLPLSVGLAGTTSYTRSHVLSTVPHARAISRDSTHTLVYKVLQMPMFSFVEMLT